jgi:CheY-like chemotaxis protein
MLLDDSELPDMIFLDINMPHLNGFEFLEKMKEYKLNDKVQVIMYTSSNSLSDQKAAQRYSNVIGYMEKPFSAQAYGRMLDMSPR